MNTNRNEKNTKQKKTSVYTKIQRITGIKRIIITTTTTKQQSKQQMKEGEDDDDDEEKKKK